MKKNGFTLIEVVVATAIFLILAVTVMDFFTNNIKIAKEEQQKAYIDSQVKNVMNYVQQSLQMSWQESINNKDTAIGNSAEDVEGIKSQFIEMEIPNNNNNAENANQNTKLVIKQVGEDITGNKIEVIKNDSAPQPLLEGYVKSFNVKISGYFVAIGLDIDYSPLIKRNLSKTFNIYYNIRKDEVKKE